MTLIEEAEAAVEAVGQSRVHFAADAVASVDCRPGTIINAVVRKWTAGRDYRDGVSTWAGAAPEVLKAWEEKPRDDGHGPTMLVARLKLTGKGRAVCYATNGAAVNVTCRARAKFTVKGKGDTE